MVPPGIFSLPRREHSFQIQLVSKAGCASESAVVLKIEIARPYPRPTESDFSGMRPGQSIPQVTLRQWANQPEDPAAQPGYYRQLKGTSKLFFQIYPVLGSHWWYVLIWLNLDFPDPNISEVFSSLTQLRDGT